MQTFFSSNIFYEEKLKLKRSKNGFFAFDFLHNFCANKKSKHDNLSNLLSTKKMKIMRCLKRL